MQTAHTPFRIAESMTYEQIGPFLAELRVKFGLSLQDVSDRLHIRPRYISAIEAGKVDDLPGAAYARGYVQSYATFLGLDAAQVVQQYFALKPVATVMPVAAPVATTQPVFTRSSVALVGAHAKPLQQKLAGQWRGLAVAAVVAILVALVIGQLMSAASPETEEVPLVAAVPEDMLSGLRTGLMPTAQNYDCFLNDAWLGCMNASHGMQTILVPNMLPLRELSEDDLAELESLAPGEAAEDEALDE